MKFLSALRFRSWFVYLLKNLFKYSALEPLEYFSTSEFVNTVCYLVVSKVACSSIKKSFIKNEIEDDYSIHSRQLEGVINSAEHPKGVYTFSFVRNPFDRLVSAYKSKFVKDLEMEGISFNYEHYLFGFFSTNDSFESFVDKVCRIPDRLSDRHFKSQFSSIYKQGELRVNYVGKFENLKDDFFLLEQRFGLSSLPHFNNTSSKSDSYMQRYTSLDMVEKVSKRFRKDIEYFKYENEYKKLLEYVIKNEKV